MILIKACTYCRVITIIASPHLTARDRGADAPNAAGWEGRENGGLRLGGGLLPAARGDSRPWPDGNQD